MSDKEEKKPRPKISKKTRSFSVRFTVSVYDKIRKAEEIKTAQQIVDFLEDQYRGLGNPVMERNSGVVDSGWKPIPEEGEAPAGRYVTLKSVVKDYIKQNRPPAARKPTKDKQSVNPKEEKPEKAPQNEPQRHHLWKEGDPKEGSGAFRLKYDGCGTYEELESLKK